jgi:uncharacterized protein YndB with AHSA1/START domain
VNHADHDANDPYAIHVDEYLPHPPARVWKALTDPDLMARWLMPNDFKLAIGHDFTFRATPIPQAGFGGIGHGTVLEFVEEKMNPARAAGPGRSRSAAARTR